MADRFEREIEDILRKIDDFVPEKGRGRRPTRRSSRPLGGLANWLTRRLASISLGQVMLYSLVLVLAAFLFRFVNPVLMRWVIIGSLIVFATAFVLSIMGGGRPANVPEKRWRGQPIDLSGPSWPDRIKYWIKGRKRR
jgi:hypothetical protein